jgi:hypothetical protein
MKRLISAPELWPLMPRRAAPTNRCCGRLPAPPLPATTARSVTAHARAAPNGFAREPVYVQGFFARELGFSETAVIFYIERLLAQSTNLR